MINTTLEFAAIAMAHPSFYLAVSTIFFQFSQQFWNRFGF